MRPPFRHQPIRSAAPVRGGGRDGLAGVTALLAEDDEAGAAARLHALADGRALAPGAEALQAVRLARSMDDNALALRFADPALIGDPTVALQLRQELGEAVGDAYLAVAGLDPVHLLSAAGALHLEGRVAEAITLLDDQLRRRPDWIEGQQTLARLRWQAGERGNWLAALKRARADRPGDATLLAVQAGLLLGADDRAGLEAVWPALEAGAAGTPMLAMLTAEVADTLGRPDTQRRFASVPAGQDRDFDLARVRHHFRAGRIAEGTRAAEAVVAASGALEGWAWVGAGWRLTGDARAAWFEADGALVRAVDLDLDGPALTALARDLNALHRDVAHPVGQSPRGGTQTLGHLLRRAEPSLRALRGVLKRAVRDYIAALPPPDPRHPVLGRARGGFRFEGAWSIRLRAQGHHVPHVHTRGWLSSACYIALPEGVGEDAADAGHPGWLQVGQPLLPDPSPAPPARLIAPRVGRLALFPAIAWHGTLPFADGERLTVAFDVVPRDQ